MKKILISILSLVLIFNGINLNVVFAEETETFSLNNTIIDNTETKNTEIPTENNGEIIEQVETNVNDISDVEQNENNLSNTTTDIIVEETIDQNQNENINEDIISPSNDFSSNDTNNNLVDNNLSPENSNESSNDLNNELNNEIDNEMNSEVNNLYPSKVIEGEYDYIHIFNDILKMLSVNLDIVNKLTSEKIISSEDDLINIYYQDNDLLDQLNSYKFDIIINQDITEIYLYEINEKIVDVNNVEWIKTYKYSYEFEILEQGYTQNTENKEYESFTIEQPITEPLPEEPTDNNGSDVIEDNDIYYVKAEYQEEIKEFETSKNKTNEEIINEAILLYALDNTMVNATINQIDDNNIHVNIENNELNEETELVTITINYRYESDDTQVFKPYVATMEKGTVFVNEIDSPTITGFDAWIYNEAGELVDGSVVSLKFESGVNESKEYTVYYKPALVNYSVKYYLQNIENDGFTEDYNEYVFNAKGYTGSMPDDQYINKQFVGFTTIIGDIEEIAADGSSEYILYFERNKYSVIPDLDGGYGVEPIYAKYQSSFVLNNPVKAGYTFVGWDINGDNIVDEIPSTIPANDMNIKAIWDANETTYTVAYWKQNPNNENLYDFIMNETLSATSSTYVSGSDKLASLGIDTTYLEYVGADQDVLVEGDGSTVVNVWYAPKEYDLRFYYAKSKYNRYYIVGGSTYYFGTLNTNDSMSVTDLIENIPDTQWGEVQVLPTLKTEASNKYTLGTTQSGSTTYYYLSFKAKYGQDISNLWPVGIFNSVPIVGSHSQTHFKEAWFSAWNGERKVWYSQHNDNQTIKGVYQELDYKLLYDLGRYSDSSVVNYMGFWDNGADVSWSIPRQWLYNIWVPQLDVNSNTLTGENEILYTFDTTDDSTDINAQTAPALEGFTYQSRTKETNPETEDGRDSYTANFYYSRNKHNISLVDVNETTEISDIYYGSKLTNIVSDPQYPDIYEENAYVFEGWYTSPLFASDTKVNFDTYTMPDENITLYAHWVKTTHNVKVYENYTDMINEENLYAEFDVPHRNTVNPGDNFKDPVRNGYTFQGYFFINERDEKELFDFESYPVTKDVKVYADWTSNIITSYEIQYKLQGTDINIAPPTNGRSFAGNTSTFYAKQSSELLPDYQEGYYPTLSSHSILMEEDHTKNIFIFEYIKLDTVPYTVQYINALNGTKLLPDKIVNNNDQTVVTEKFQFINGMIPDKFYKSLILSADSSLNVITFYYTPDTLHARYNINCYIEQLDGTYTSYTNTEGIGNIGASINAQILSLPGYTYNASKSTSTGTITSQGLELNLYYDLNEVNYTIKYLEYDTDEVLADEKNGSGKFKETITATAIDIDHYELVGPETKTLTLTPDETVNIIIFYYRKAKLNIAYEVVSDEPCDDCLVSLKSEIISDISMASGSEAINNNEEKFDFIGWFKDEAGEELISEELSFVPTEAKSATYYAHFKAVHTITYEWNKEDIKDLAELPIDKTRYHNGDDVIIDETFKEGDEVLVINEDGLVTGKYVFSGWTCDETVFNKKDIIVTGEWVFENSGDPDPSIRSYLNTGGSGWSKGIFVTGTLCVIAGLFLINQKRKRS